MLVWFSTFLRVLVKRGIALRKDRESYCGSHPSPHSCSLVKASSRLPSSVWRAPFEDQHSTQRDEGSIVVKVRPHTTPLSLLLLYNLLERDLFDE